MTDVTAAGWFADPTGRHELRWFDGTAWTDQVSDGGTVATDPVGVAPAAAAGSPGGGGRGKVVLVAVAVVAVLAIGFVVLGGDDGLSEDEAQERVDAAVEAGVDAADLDEDADDGGGTAFENALDWLACGAEVQDEELPDELADAGPETSIDAAGDRLLVGAIAFDGGAATLVRAALSDDAVDCFDDAVTGEFDFSDVELDVDADEGEAGDAEAVGTVDVVLFDDDVAIRLEARLVAVGQVVVVVVAVGDEDGDVADGVDDVVDAAVEAAAG
jgi:hypothetical protein